MWWLRGFYGNCSAAIWQWILIVLIKIRRKWRVPFFEISLSFRDIEFKKYCFFIYFHLFFNCFFIEATETVVSRVPCGIVICRRILLVVSASGRLKFIVRSRRHSYRRIAMVKNKRIGINVSINFSYRSLRAYGSITSISSYIRFIWSLSIYGCFFNEWYSIFRSSATFFHARETSPSSCLCAEGIF